MKTNTWHMCRLGMRHVNILLISKNKTLKAHNDV